MTRRHALATKAFGIHPPLMTSLVSDGVLDDGALDLENNQSDALVWRDAALDDIVRIDTTGSRPSITWGDPSAGVSSTYTWRVPDARTFAWLVEDDSGNNYIQVDTNTTLDRAIRTGNTTTNPILEHLGSGDVRIGSQIRLTEIGSDPANVADNGFIYTKDVGTITELFYEDSSGNVVQVTSGGSLAGGGGSNTLDQAYDQGGAGAGNSITVDTVEVELVRGGAAETHYALAVKYNDVDFTGTPHGIHVDWTAISAGSLSNAGDVYGIRLDGEPNIGAGDSIGLSIDGSWDRAIDVSEAIWVNVSGSAPNGVVVTDGSNVMQLRGGASSNRYYWSQLGGAINQAFMWLRSSNANRDVAIIMDSTTSSEGNWYVGFDRSTENFAISSGDILGSGDILTLGRHAATGNPGGASTLRGGDGLGTDQAGGDVTLAGGASTGTGQAGAIRLEHDGIQVGEIGAGNVFADSGNVYHFTHLNGVAPTKNPIRIDAHDNVDTTDNTTFQTIIELDLSGAEDGSGMAMLRVVGTQDATPGNSYQAAIWVTWSVSAGSVTIEDTVKAHERNDFTLGATPSVDNGAGGASIRVQVKGADATTIHWIASFDSVNGKD